MRVRLAALLLASMGLMACGPSLKSSDWKDRVEAVRQVPGQDQAVLAKVALEDKDRDVRVAAVKRLTDQSVLAKVALDDKDWNVRLAAAARLADQSILEKVAAGDRETRVRIAAVQRLTDQATLGKVALDEKQMLPVRTAAAERLTDQATLANVAKLANDGRWGSSLLPLSVGAVERISDQAILAKVVEGSPHPDVSAKALAKITDQSILLKMAQGRSSRKTCIAVLAKLTDHASLERVALESPACKDSYSIHCCKTFVWDRLSDQSFLVKVALTAEDTVDRNAALVRVKGEEFLLMIAVEGGDLETRLYAVRKLPPGSERRLEEARAKQFAKLSRWDKARRLGQLALDMAPHRVYTMTVAPMSSKATGSGSGGWEPSPLLQPALKEFRALLAAGADPSAVRIAGDPLRFGIAPDGRVTMSAVPPVGPPVPATEPGLTLAQYFAVAGIREGEELIRKHRPKGKAR